MKNTSRKPYIYKVTNLENHQYYIGSQCSGKILGLNYFTSSTNKVFKEGFKTYREEKYKIEIIKSFIDPKKCVRAENYIIRNHMLLKDGLCLNRFYRCGGEKVFSMVGTHGWNKGIPRSEETKHKISKTLQGHPGPNKGIPRSEETRKKLSETHKGIPRSEETKQKMSGAKKNRIKISIEGTVFDSLTEASKYYNVSVEAIRKWVKTKNHNAVCVEKCPKI